MEKEEQNWEQEEVEEQQEEETTVLVRKSRNEYNSKTIDIAAVDVEEVSNGVSESNGHSELAANGVKSEESILEEEQKIEELDGVLENESEVINGEQKSENLVFHDKTEGIWKCRLCSWTYQNGSLCLDHIQTHKGLLHKLMNVDALNFESEGVESASKNFGEKQIVKDSGDNKLDASYEGVPENDSLSSSKLQPPQTSFQESSTDHKPSKEIESAEVDLEDLEVAEFDVERVIQKQTTHDLYCPNCNSCITKRVILRKRKRRVRVSDEEVKRNKIEADIKLGTGSVQPTGDQIHCADDTQLPTVDEDERDRGPDIFRCFSCFSFFIPTRHGFKLFRIFGSNKPATALDQGTSIQTDAPKGGDGISPSSDLGDQSGQPSSSKQPHSPSHVVNNDNPEGADATVPSPQQKPMLNGIGAEHTVATDLNAVQLSPPSVSTVKASDMDGNLHISVSIPHQDQDIKATILTESVENKHANFTSNDSGQIHSTDVSQHVITKTKFEIHSGDSLKVDNIPPLEDTPVQQGSDTRITIDAQPVGSPETLQDTMTPTETASLIQPATQTSVTDQERAEARKELQFEVMKSIVYGGLAESITSLSVVSSAAGGGAATLNVLAVGLANLIGGFFIICHNLWELGSDDVEQVANQVSHGAPHQRDRYKELLGQRHHFILHFIVAVISYLVFGSVAPAVYGFSFRQTDDKQLKLFVTAAACLVCIIILAIGRAYVRSPPKPYLKTVVAFVISGFMVSGVSYAGGQLVAGLLEKLGLFQSSSVPKLLLNEMITTGSERASL